MKASIRKLKTRASIKRTTRAWWGMDADKGSMYFIRHVRPCATYSANCADCVAVRFRKDMGRFPHTLEEFSKFEDACHEEADPGWLAMQAELCAEYNRAHDAHIEAQLKEMK